MSRFAAVPTAALDDERVEAMHIRVLTSLCSFADKDGWCRVGQDRIAKRARTNKARVSQAISDLCDWGWVDRIRHGKQQANAYQVLMDRDFDPELSADYGDIESEEVADTANHSCRESKSQLPTRQIHKNTVSNTVSNKVDFSIFEEAWKLYQSCSLKASGQTKKKARDQWGRSVRKADPQEILKAIRLAVEARRAPKDFIPPLPDMFRWLKDERYADVLREAKPRIVETPVEDWKVAARNYVDSSGNTWPAYLGDPPHYPTCRAPDEILNRIRRLLADDPAAPKIPQRSAA